MGCVSSSSSGTEQSNKVKNQQVVLKQEVGVNYNSTTAVVKSKNVHVSLVKTNNDQSLSQDRTTSTNNDQSVSQDRTTSTNNDQSLSQDRTTSTNNDQSLSQDRTTTTNNDQSLSQDQTTSTKNDQSLYQRRTTTISKVKSQDLKLNFNDFKDIDEHARQTPRSVEESIETLAKYLAKPAKNDLEVVRALYVWICENIRYDTNAYFSKNVASLDTSGNGVLTSKSSVCAGYANLFESLCQTLGITCKNISGYAKGYSYKPGDVITFYQKTNHAWNAVRLNGVWRFIETTWGAGHVGKNQQFIKEFNNFFFLTSPENFIYDHFPCNNIEESKQWQLLEKPISIEEYTRKIRPSKEAKQYGVKFSSHPHEIILVNSSPCTIIVESSANPFQDCWFDFYDDKGSKCTDAAIMICEGSEECKTTVRPPYRGKYTLCLHAIINHESTTLVEYIINCGTAEPNWKPFPKHTGHYGINPDFTDSGLETSCIKPFYECKDGNFHLSLKTSSTPEVLVQLHDAENVDHKENLLVEQTDTSINIRSRLLNKGYYKLELFSKVDEKYTLAYTVLILNTGESDWKPFPKNTGHYGSKARFY
ncbi:unnamed protein product [Mytilus edulis]|uniref:Transglutaminase-like domain-containing protein n=1 Tax=Mytilus edulis TaxID=6550 RepID=A0A8S3U8U9_MYTED|nr:unnamed protein product [Mytilus edulis]